MPQKSDINRRIVLAQRPKGLPDESTLRLENANMPVPGEDEMLLRTLYLSIDPYMRGRMNDTKSYTKPVAIDEVMTGQVVAEVISSRHADYVPGELVLAGNGWQDYAVSDGSDVTKLGSSPPNPTWSLGILGMPGFTAYAGLLSIGEPKAGETLVVAAASGPVGATVGQIGKIHGCRVVGVAGGSDKCKHVVENLGFDMCLNHRDSDFSEQLQSACPEGIDVYFENVGGKVLYTVLPLLNPFARVPVCGVASWYNLNGLPDGPDFGPAILSTVLRMKVKMQGFIVYDNFSAALQKKFEAEMTQWIEQGKIYYKENIVQGLESAPKALNDVLLGNAFGKTVIKVA